MFNCKLCVVANYFQISKQWYFYKLSKGIYSDLMIYAGTLFQVRWLWLIVCLNITCQWLQEKKTKSWRCSGQRWCGLNAFIEGNKRQIAPLNWVEFTPTTRCISHLELVGNIHIGLATVIGSNEILKYILPINSFRFQLFQQLLRYNHC